MSNLPLKITQKNIWEAACCRVEEPSSKDHSEESRNTVREKCSMRYKKATYVKITDFSHSELLTNVFQSFLNMLLCYWYKEHVIYYHDKETETRALLMREEFHSYSKIHYQECLVVIWTSVVLVSYMSNVSILIKIPT